MLSKSQSSSSGLRTWAVMVGVLTLVMLLLVPGAPARANGPLLGVETKATETASPSMSLSASSITSGDDLIIEYTLKDAYPGNWIGIYAKGDKPGTQSTRAYHYVAETEGAITWSGAATDGWIVQSSLDHGAYEVYLFEDNGYRILAGPEPLEVVEGPAPLPLPQTGETADLRVLTWNIFHGGKSSNNDDLVNRKRVSEYISSLDPDVFVAIETYGAAETILAELNDNNAGDVFTGTQITQQGNDNLWIFSRLPVIEILPAPSDLSVNTFNLGGIRVRLDNNREATIYDVWSSYTNPWIGDLIEENAHDVQANRQPRHSNEEVLAADRVQTKSIADFIAYADQYSPSEDDVAIISGDLNTVASEDWHAQWATCDSHFGLSYDFSSTTQFAEAGYVDAFRVANPDVCLSPGVTWSPRLDMDTPDRIDLAYARGTGVTVADSQILDERLAAHGPGQFYSDHSALLNDFRVASTDGSAPPVNQAKMELDATEVVAGESLTLNGSGFLADETVTVELRSQQPHLAELTADASGNLNTTLTIPADTVAGEHSIVILRADGSELTATITVVAKVNQPPNAAASGNTAGSNTTMGTSSAEGSAAAVGTASGHASASAQGLGQTTGAPQSDADGVGNVNSSLAHTGQQDLLSVLLLAVGVVVAAGACLVTIARRRSSLGARD